MSPFSVLAALDRTSYNCLHYIFRFLDRIYDLPSLAFSAQFLKVAVCSATSLWTSQAVDMCIVQTCFGCGRRKVSRHLAAFLIENTDMNFARLHISFNDLPGLAESILRKNALKKLHLRIGLENNYSVVIAAAANDSSTYSLLGKRTLTNRDDSNSQYSTSRNGCNSTSCHTSWVPLSNSIVPKHCSLESLTVYGWPEAFQIMQVLEYSFHSFLSHISGGVAGQLSNIEFRESAPYDIFPQASLHCPNLKQLHVEGSRIMPNSVPLLKLKSLQSLVLKDTSLKCLEPLQCTSLTKFSLVSRMEEFDGVGSVMDVHRLVKSLPKSLKELHLSVRSMFANAVIMAIGGWLPHLEKLQLWLPDNSIADYIDKPDVIERSHWMSDLVDNGALLCSVAASSAPAVDSDNGNNRSSTNNSSSNNNDSSPQEDSAAGGDENNNNNNGDDGDNGDVVVDIRTINTVYQLDKTHITESAINTLMSNCPHLQTIELSGGLLTIEAQGFAALLTKSTHLRSVAVTFDDELLELLSTGDLLPRSSNALEELIFYDSAAEIADASNGEFAVWDSMESKVATVAERFPAVAMSLQDAWWTL